jgi:hypothetical protein
VQKDRGGFTHKQNRIEIPESVALQDIANPLASRRLRLQDAKIHTAE